MYMSLIGLLWRRFEKYPEDNASAMYGRPAQDPFGSFFPNFEYTSVHGTS